MGISLFDVWLEIIVFCGHVQLGFGDFFADVIRFAIVSFAAVKAQFACFRAHLLVHLFVDADAFFGAVTSKFWMLFA